MDPGPADREVLAGRYRLGRLLGRGGMAEVYDAFDERLARPVAVKILRPSAADDIGLRLRFEREARSAARLSHPAVVAVYDSGEDRGRAFLVMERLPGETLADRFRPGPVDQRWLASVAADVLAALGAAHALGLVHRDIKPANILLADDGRAKVADFGIAKTSGPGWRDPSDEDLTATGLILGTVAYLSPEQIAGSAASPQADIYAVGVVAYEALAGRKPFLGENPIAQAHAVAEGRPPELTELRPDVDARLAAVVRRAMARRPEDRYQSAPAMLADLTATGLTGTGLTVPGLTVPGLTVPGLTVPGLTVPGLTVPGLTDPGLTDPGLTDPGLTDPGLTDPGLTATGRVVPGGIVPGGIAPGRTVGGRLAGRAGPGPGLPIVDATGVVPPAPATGRRRGRAGLVGAVAALAVVVVAVAVIAVLLHRNSSPTTITPPATSTTSASSTPATAGAPAATVAPISSVTVPSTTASSSTASSSTASSSTASSSTASSTTAPSTTAPSTTASSTTATSGVPTTAAPTTTGPTSTAPTATAPSTTTSPGAPAPTIAAGARRVPQGAAMPTVADRRVPPGPRRRHLGSGRG